MNGGSGGEGLKVGEGIFLSNVDIDKRIGKFNTHFRT